MYFWDIIIKWYQHVSVTLSSYVVFHRHMNVVTIRKISCTWIVYNIIREWRLLSYHYGAWTGKTSQVLSYVPCNCKVIFPSATNVSSRVNMAVEYRESWCIQIDDTYEGGCWCIVDISWCAPVPNKYWSMCNTLVLEAKGKYCRSDSYCHSQMGWEMEGYWWWWLDSTLPVGTELISKYRKAVRFTVYLLTLS